MSDLPKVRTICAICKKVIEEGREKKDPSHGHCDPCNIKWLWMAGLSETELTGFTNMMKEKYGDKL